MYVNVPTATFVVFLKCKYYMKNCVGYTYSSNEYMHSTSRYIFGWHAALHTILCLYSVFSFNLIDSIYSFRSKCFSIFVYFSRPTFVAFATIN